MFKTVFKSFFSTCKAEASKICIVGAGPAGFYAAQHLVKKLPDVTIDILERLPVPYGLVRFGVAPDHPEVKNVIHTFMKTAGHPNVNFYGNIQLGKDVLLGQLKEFYNVVLLTYGAEENQKLNIPGENLKNVIPARNIVGWYNGLPSDKDLKIDLSVENVAIIGQGNVAMDVARILLTPIDELKKTDITQHSLDQLAQSKIQRVHLIGRRGPLQAAYTIKELREMLKLKTCTTTWRKQDFTDLNETGLIEKLPRPKKRITELMLKSVKDQTQVTAESHVFNPIFLRSPIELVGEDAVEKLILGVNKLQGEDFSKQRAVLTDDRETLESGLVINSIGYSSIQADPAIPFDFKKGIVKNENGKVSVGLYTSGWLSTGPLGVILTTMSNAFGVADQIIQDIPKDNMLTETKPGFSALKDILKKNNIQFVQWKDWEKIDKYEIQQGEKVGKPREKIVDVNKMLEVASS